MKTPITMSVKKQHKLNYVSEQKIAVSKKSRAAKSIEELMREADLHFEFAIEMIPRPRKFRYLF